MAITATKKFTYIIDGQARIFFPGSHIEDDEAAGWALDQGYGEDRPDERAEPAPANKAFSGAPSNKQRGERPDRKLFRRARGDDGKPVLGSEDEIEQDDPAGGEG